MPRILRHLEHTQKNYTNIEDKENAESESYLHEI